MVAKTKPTDEGYVRMFYEHQYDRMGKEEGYRLTITNYVLTVSALAFTFGYQSSTQLTVMNGIGLPFIILIVNLFAMIYIERTSEVINAQKKRAREILNRYAPELNEINHLYGWAEKRFSWRSKGASKGTAYPAHFDRVHTNRVLPLSAYLRLQRLHALSITISSGTVSRQDEGEKPIGSAPNYSSSG
jgi:hypothetical protein